MNHLTPKEWDQLLSLYIDGELDAESTKALESYLASHPAAARQVEVLRLAKEQLGKRPALPANDWFWLKLSNRIEAEQSRPAAVRRPSFAIASLAVLTAVIIGSIYYKDSPMFHRFFREKAMQAEHVVRNNIMTGNILPLFNNLDNDDVLNFALSGSIQIDSANNTALQVKNSTDSGSQIQIVHNGSPAVVPVTMTDFADELGISHGQREVVDSILDTYKQRLQASVLVSEHEQVAIHSELAELNRAMVSTIAACLEPPQRSRFQRFLDKRNAPYAVVAVNSPSVPSHIILNRIPKVSAGNTYVVISPDTVEFAAVTIDLDSIRESSRREHMQLRRTAMQRMLAELTERQRRMEENMIAMGQNRARVHSTSGALQIHFEHATADPGVEMASMVRPRLPENGYERRSMSQVTVFGDSLFTFELPADDEAVQVFRRLPQGEFRFERLDTLMREPKVKLLFRSPSSRKAFESRLKEHPQSDEPLIDLDSLLRESEKSEAPSGKPQHQPKGTELELMM